MEPETKTQDGREYVVKIDGVPGGVTKREFFAAMALIGCLASDNAPAAERAVEIADDLIEALNKPRHRYDEA